MNLRLTLSPKTLPAARRLGRTVLLDLAFASGGAFVNITEPFIAALGECLVAWIDHHPHPGWSGYRDDPRFFLVDKQTAPACPELVTPELVSELGAVETILAHADFDGCLAAAKYLRHGREPYPGADADARAIDAPGRGFVCSTAGRRLALAIDHKKSVGGAREYLAWLSRLNEALVTGHQPADLDAEIDALAAEQRRRLAELEPLLTGATRPHPEILVLSAPSNLSPSDRKALLCSMEEEARMAVVQSGPRVTVATFEDKHFDLSDLPGLEGARGLAWGKVDLDSLLHQLVALLRTINDAGSGGKP